jgi:type IV pilus assembly protein PilB
MSHESRLDADRLIAELDALLGAAPQPRSAAVEALIFSEPVAPAPRPAVRTPAPPIPEPVRPAPAPAPEAQPSPRGARKVLVIDDDSDYREIVTHLLIEDGFGVVTAKNGREGVRLAKSSMPDLVLVDFNMPGLNGYEVIQELKSDFDTRSIPIVMFTGANNRAHLKTLGMEIADFLDKPVPNERLLGAVRKALGRPDVRPLPDGDSGQIVLNGHGVRRNTAEPPPQPGAASESIQIELNQPGVRRGAASESIQIELNAPGVRRSAAENLPPPPSSLTKIRVEAAPSAPAPSGEPIMGEGDDLGADGDLLVDVEKDEKKEADHSLEDVSNDSPLVSRVNKILVRAVEMGASDIHIEPQEHSIVVRVRINGSLQKLCVLPEGLKTRLVARIKIMSNLVITERRRPQDGQFRAHIKGNKVEFRVSCLPSIQGENLVLRVLGGGKVKASIEGLGFSARDLDCVRPALESPHGLILVTGPTGSGKTTTLYTMIRAVSKPDVHVCTAEDPVEYEMPGITQVHVKPAIGLTFENVLRSFLRQDPDVMLVGEIRDLETEEIAVKASITGHLVFSTLHTNSAPATVTRLTQMGLPAFLLAASVKLIVAQRLIKTLCPHCKLQVPISDDERKFLAEEEAERLKLVYRGVGCARCQQSGYSGRKPLFEVMPVRTPAMREMIVAGGGPDGIQKVAVAEGMHTLRQAAVDCVAAGEASLGEAFKLILAD